MGEERDKGRSNQSKKKRVISTKVKTGSSWVKTIYPLLCAMMALVISLQVPSFPDSPS